MDKEDVHKELMRLADNWARAELHSDTAFLRDTLADDFVGVGPRGFLLTKQEWLQRHEAGALTYAAYALDDVTVRVYGEAAVLTARAVQRGAYMGHDVGGQLRQTLVFVTQDGRWRLASLHMSPLADNA